MHGILLLAHGAKNPGWSQPFDKIANHLKIISPNNSIVLGYLNFIHPSLPEAGKYLVAQNCKYISVIPLLFGTGKHIQEDIPQAIDHLSAQYPHIIWKLYPAIGEIPAFTISTAEIVSALIDDDQKT
jgi:sirohydrochlorin cobaltochelatase